MEGFRQYLGKTITLGTKKCGPGECFVGTFYTINLAEGLFVFKDGLFPGYLAQQHLLFLSSVVLAATCLFIHCCWGVEQSARKHQKK